MFEALHRLRFQSYLSSLSAEDEQGVLDLIGSLGEYVDNESFERFVNSPTFSGLFIDYNKFVDNQSLQSELFGFWSNYLEMIEILLLHIRAVRTGDWMLHLSAVKSMLPWFFVTDRVNYSRYASCYWIEMSSLDETHEGNLLE